MYSLGRKLEYSLKGLIAVSGLSIKVANNTLEKSAANSSLKKNMIL